MIPVSEARDIAERYELNIVLLVAWEAVNNVTSLVTYGVTSDQKQCAAESGERIAKVLNLNEPLETHEDYRRPGERAEAFDALLRACKGLLTCSLPQDVSGRQFVEDAQRAIAIAEKVC